MSWYTKQKLAAKEDSSAEAYLARIGVPEETISYITTITNPQLKNNLVGYLSKNPLTTVEALMNQVRTPTQQKQQSNTNEEIQLVKQYNNLEFQQWALVQMRKIRTAFSLRPQKPYNPNQPIREEDLIEGQMSYNLHNINLVLQNVFDWYVRGVLPARQALAQAQTPEQKIEVTNEYGVTNINTNLANLSLDQANELAEDWHNVVSGQGEGYEYFGEKKENIVYGPQWKNPQWQGWTIRSVTTANNLKAEGNKAGHCVGRYCNDVLSGATRIFSLRDPNNTPYVTMEASPKSWTFNQIFGDGPKSGNAEPSQTSKAMIGEWLQTLPGARVGDTSFDYDLSYRDMDEDLEKAIYRGADDYGLPPNLAEWDFDDAYKSVVKALDIDRRGGNGGYKTREVAPVLARAAIDSDKQKIEQGLFSKENVTKKAMQLILNARKYHYKKITQVPPEILSQYLLRAQEDFKGSKDHAIQQRINERAFHYLLQEKLFDSSKLKSIKDVDPKIAREYLSSAIDSMSAISHSCEKRQENDEDFSDYYESSEPEPIEEDFETPEEYNRAHMEWEKNEEFSVDYARGENLLCSLDDSIFENLNKLIPQKGIKLPYWMSRYFSAKQGNRPNLVWAVTSAIQRSKKKASGWYQIAKYGTHDLDHSYMDIGHSGFLHGDFGCNIMWAITTNGEFISVPETQEQNYHAISGFPANIIYKGRIDTCKKAASISGLIQCSKHALANNPLKENYCQRLKYKAIAGIKQFGSNIRIQEF